MEEQTCRFRTENRMTIQRTNEFSAGYQESLLLYHILRLFEIYMLINFAVMILLLPQTMGSIASKMLGLGAFLLVLELLPKILSRKGNLSYRRSLITNGGREMHNELLFFEDEILDRNLDNGNTVTYPYGSIRRIFRTKNLLVIMLDARLGILVEKASLSGGTQEEFAAFLLEKSVKIKKKKIHGVRFGQILRYVMLGAVLIMMLAALWELPPVQYHRHLRKDPTAALPFREVADVLEEFGITGADEELLDGLEESYSTLTTMEKADTSKALWLMSYLGDQDYYPGAHGVIWQSPLPDEPDVMYREFINNMNILVPDLELTCLSEETELFPDGSQGGSLTVSCRGEVYQTSYYGDWFNWGVLWQLQTVLASDEDPEYLFCAYGENDDVLIFYRDMQWAEKFTAATGIELHSGIYTNS